MITTILIGILAGILVATIHVAITFYRWHITFYRWHIFCRWHKVMKRIRKDFADG